MQNLTLLGFSGLLSLGLLEVALGAARPREVIGRLPAGRYRFVNHEFVQHTTINRLGFRASGFAPTRRTQRVLLLGDSFVEGTGQSDEETTARLLNRHFADRSYQVFNAGVSGTDISDYAEIYRKVVAAVPFRFARVFVVIFLGNDFLDYERVAEVKRRSREQQRPPEDPRWLLRAMGSLLPNTLESIREARRRFGDRAVPAMPHPYTAETHIDWFNENHDYFARPPLSEEEKDRLRRRFDRIPPESRELIRQGLVNRWCYHLYVTEALHDFTFNMDSDYNEAVFSSTMRRLDELIGIIDAQVSIVLIPDKFQVSEAEQRVARTIMGANAQEDEFDDLFRLNARVASWIQARHPGIRVYDATADLVNRDPASYYYHIDGHMNPRGADLVARGILSLIP